MKKISETHLHFDFDAIATESVSRILVSDANIIIHNTAMEVSYTHGTTADRSLPITLTCYG